MDSETSYWVGFSVFPGIGPVRFKLLIDYFGSARAAWEAPLATLKTIRLGEKLSEQFDHFRRTFSLDAYMEQLAREHVAALTLNDVRYPKLLKEISDAPFVLYVKGKRTKEPLNLDKTIAVVGTRKITRYGEEVTHKLVTGLVAYGYTIVSGLAYGVDAAAHQAAINAHGKTIAVLGCGIDIIAPPSNANLYRRIADGYGAIVSEMPLGLRPGKGLFPARNRIISGLSLGIIVTEGAEDSGALITARYAAEQGREVFAVPGPITSPYSRGPAKLLKSGARLVESAEDVLAELGDTAHVVQSATVNAYTPQSEEEALVLQTMEGRRVHIDEVVRNSTLPSSVALSTLTMLELKRVVKDYGGKIYGRI